MISSWKGDREVGTQVPGEIQDSIAGVHHGLSNRKDWLLIGVRLCGRSGSS